MTDNETSTTFAQHSDFSDPGRHAALLAAVPTGTPSLHTAVTSAIVHYRAEEPTPEQELDIDARWVAAICDTVTQRFDGPLSTARPDAQKSGGCCRDHSLLAVAILREHGIPARSRVGFAHYFNDGFANDHVVVERWQRGSQTGRWVRFDPEFDASGIDGRAHDLPTGPDAPFQTASRAWLAYRDGNDDLLGHGVDVNMTHLTGPGFVQGYVIRELAHLMRTELLLWDLWGVLELQRPEPGKPMAQIEPFLGLTDQLARLIIAADDGDSGAWERLTELWRTDERVRPERVVLTASPTGRFGDTDLHDRTTTWHSGP